MCVLCEAEHRTEWLYEDDICWVAKCSTHRHQWMVVLKRHVVKPTEEEYKHIETVLDKYFLLSWRYRGVMLSIPDHWHQHLIM